MCVNLTGIFKDDFFLRKLGEILFFFPLILYYLRKIPFKNFNFLMFLSMAMGATLFSWGGSMWYFEHIKLGMWLDRKSVV